MAKRFKAQIKKSVAFHLRLAEARANNLASCFSEENRVELLLSKGIPAINIYLFEILIQKWERYPILNHVKKDQLYLVYSPTLEPDGFQCFLGKDILEPSFKLDTVGQLKESFEWHKEHSTFDSRHCKNLDDWVKFKLKICFYKLESCVTLLSLGLMRWQDVFLEEGVLLQRTLLDHELFLLRGLRLEISELKNKNAPEFMINAAGQNLERIKATIRKLGQTLLY